MRDFAKTLATRMERGSGSAAPLFFVVCAFFFVSAFILAATLHGRRDTLLAHAPSESVFYAHATGAAAGKLLALSGDGALAEAQPREAAAFLFRRHDGTLAKGTLVAWSRRPLPSALATLKSVDARLIDGRVYLVGDTAAGSLAEDAEVRRGLATAASAFTTQAYVEPAELPELGFDGAFSGLGPIVLGARISANDFSAVVMPSETASAFGPLGWRVPKTDTSVRTDIESGAALALTQATPDFSPFDLLFGGALGEDLTSVADRPKAELVTILDSPVTLSLDPGVQDGLNIVLHYRTQKPAAVSGALERFAASAWPIREPLRLPDRETIAELLFDGDRFRFTPVDSTTEDGLMRMVINSKLSFDIRPDGSNGTLLANKPGLIEKMTSRSQLMTESCPHIGEESLRLRINPQLFKIPIPLISSLNQLVVGKIGDNMMLFCGYRDLNVDK